MKRKQILRCRSSKTCLLYILCFLGFIEFYRYVIDVYRSDPVFLREEIGTKIEDIVTKGHKHILVEELITESKQIEDTSKHLNYEQEENNSDYVYEEKDGPQDDVKLKEKNKVKKILILAYARSGSSFTGELMSAGFRAAYYYEPLFSLRPNGTAIENVIMRDPSQSNLVQTRINGLFNCYWPLLKKLNKGGFPTVRKRGLKCRASNPRVIKTIRLRRAGLEPWIYDSDVQVVHLVRDPRGMISSISKRPGVWSNLLNNSSFQCKRMLDDSKLEEKLPKDRYIRVRYEDLVDNTETTISSVYSSLGLDFSKHVKNVVFSHTHAENVTGTNGHGYYNTFRGSNFGHDSWKKKLGLEHVRKIEKGCKDFMDLAGYTALPDPTIETL